MLDRSLRTSIPSRVSAVGFIIVILAGNIWLVDSMLAKPVERAVVYVFFAGIGVTACGALGLIALMLLRLSARLRGKDVP